jgi:hypothetical protein
MEYWDPSPFLFIPFDLATRQVGFVTCSHLDVLPHHRPKATTKTSHGLKPPNHKPEQPFLFEIDYLQYFVTVAER